MTPSTRLIPESDDRPGDDPIFALNAEAKRRASEWESILDSTLGALTTEDGRLPVMPSVFEACRRVSPETAAACAPVSGAKPFQAVGIDDLFDGSVLADSAVASATPEGTGACRHAIVNFLEPGQEILTTSYYWGPYAILADHTRLGVAVFRMFDEAGGFDVDALADAVDRQVDEQGRVLRILNTPCNNPTGFTIADVQKERRARTSGAFDSAITNPVPRGSTRRPRARRPARGLLDGPSTLPWASRERYGQLAP